MALDLGRIFTASRLERLPPWLLRKATDEANPPAGVAEASRQPMLHQAQAGERLAELRTMLLRGKTWRYLRYLHLRDSIAKVASQIETVCVCGAGRGWAELALAIEFPHLRWTLTDIVDPAGYPNYHGTMQLCWKWNIDSVLFSVWNVLQPTKRRFDLVCSTEMLEHIKQDDRAAKNMRGAATKFVYCLVPFADTATNDDAVRRERILASHGHFVLGYDAERLIQLFGSPRQIAGTYWTDAGGAWRRQMKSMSAEQIEQSAPALMSLAESDLRDEIPRSSSQAQGIKILAAV